MCVCVAYSQVYPKPPAKNLVCSSHTIISSCGRSEDLVTDENEPMLVEGSFSYPFADEDFQGGEGPKVTASEVQTGDLLIPRCSGVSFPHGHPIIQGPGGFSGNSP